MEEYIKKSSARHAVLHNEGQAAVAAIEAIQPEDVVPVVRCGDCKWACLAPARQTATCMRKRVPFTHDYEWFCADGERGKGKHI